MVGRRIVSKMVMKRLQINRTSLWLMLVVLSIISIQQTNAIGCYVCSSINSSDPRCEDEFHAYPELYEGSCMAARKERRGLFPATKCIKFKASDEGKTILVRNCALYNGGITKDVEIGMLDHCGWINDIKYNGVDMKGCILTCDTDGCNLAWINSAQPLFVFVLQIFLWV